ncbi:MAG: hypothetical protein ACRCYX_01775 [Dermatophilaceae bacterium]
MTIVPGDPGSMSSAAATVRAVAERMTAQAAALSDARAGLDDDWPGSLAAATQRRAAALGAAASTTAAELDRIGRALQEHSTDLADLVARGRALEARASSAGLAVRDGRVVPAWGVVGEADAGTARERDILTGALQAELDHVLVQFRRRRDRLTSVIDTSGSALAQVSQRLRQG